MTPSNPLLPIRGELRKAVGPVFGVLLIAVFSLIWAAMISQTGIGEIQPEMSVRNVSQLRTEITAECLVDTDDSSDECILSRSRAELADATETNSMELGGVAAAMDTPQGVLRFVSHHFATTIGWVFVAIVAAYHVAGEWHSGSALVSAPASGSRQRFFINKIFSTWLTTLSGFALVSVAMIIARPSFARTPMVSDGAGGPLTAIAPDPAWASTTGAISHAAIAALVLLTVSAVGVGLAMVTKRPIATALALISAVIIQFVLAQSSDIGWLPSTVIAKSLGMDQWAGGFYSDRVLWAFPGSDLSLGDPALLISANTGSTLLLVVILGAMISAALTVVNRRQVL